MVGSVVGGLFSFVRVWMLGVRNTEARLTGCDPMRRRLSPNRAQRAVGSYGPFEVRCESVPLGMAWICGPPGFLLSTQGPNGFRESAKAPRVWADAEIELEASARQRRFFATF